MAKNFITGRMAGLIVCAILAQAGQGRIIYVDADAPGTNNGGSWSDAHWCLQDALAGSDYGDEIRVAQGVYRPDRSVVIDARSGSRIAASGDRTATFQLINGVAVRGGYAGFGESDPDARDIDSYQTVLSGDLNGDDIDVNDPADLLTEQTRADNSYHVVTGSGVNQTAVVDGFTIVSGYANGSGANADGGGMYTSYGSPSVTNCIFSRNTAGSDGGGMYNCFYSSPSVDNCTFSSNTVISTDYWTGGGGMCNYFNSSPTVTNCSFSTNAVISLNEVTGGGGLCNTFYCSPTLTECTFRRNLANNGGGVVNVLSAPSLTDCMFVGNFVNIAGGGLVNLNCSPTVTNCMFIGNSACFGGGMSTDGENTESRPKLTNCTFSRNFALFNGGGMHNYAQGSPTLINCTFSGNQALDYGGGMVIEYDSNVTLTNCILWANEAPRGPQIAVRQDSTAGPSNLTISYSNVQGGQAAVHRERYCTLDWDDSSFSEDPLFVDPDGLDNEMGTEDDNLRLLISSPCIDAGTSNTPAALPSTDLDGDSRILDGSVDMGAYEGAKGSVLFSLSAQSVTVPEGQTASFTVALLMDPQQMVEVEVACQSGDPDISVQSGNSITFDRSNYSVPQTVTLAAAQDDDYLYGTAFVSVTVPGVVSAGLKVVEQDDEPVPPVLFVDGRAGGSEDGTNWKAAFRDLQAALCIARSAKGVEEIRVAAGTYAPAGPLGARTATFELVHGVAIYGGFPAGGDWEDRDPNIYETILSGDLNGNDGPDGDNNDDNSYHVVSCSSSADPNTILDGFVITAGNANGPTEHNVGGGMYSYDGSPTVANCTFERNSARFSGGMYCYGGSPVTVNCTFTGNSAYAWGGAVCTYKCRGTLADCTFIGNSAGGLGNRHGGGISCEASDMILSNCNITDNTPDGVWMGYGRVQIDGEVRVAGNDWVGTKVMLGGDGTLLIDCNSVLSLHDSKIRCDVFGPGVLYVGYDSELTVGGNATVDLGHETDPSANGRIICHGLLRLQDNTTVADAQVYVARASFEDNAIVANCVINAEAGAPYGQLFIEDNVNVWLDKIEADGDRYLDLDPRQFDCNGIHVDTIEVRITEGVRGSHGGLFELRGRDMKIPPADSNEFLHQVDRIPDFDPGTWTIDRLELVEGAKLNLTNRFDFQAPYESGGDYEVLYVKKLILGPSSILNTAFNHVYYETLVMDPTAKLVCVPLLGFSLKNIGFDDENDFLSRVKHNNLEHADNSAYDRIHVERVTGLEPDPNGMMRMRNLRDLDPESPDYQKLINARAKGLFAKASEDRILVLFEYLFEMSDPNTELVVYLSDVPEMLDHSDPNRADRYLEVARIPAPPMGRPGSAGSGRFGVFEKTVSKSHLNFVRGTRIELELIGTEGACVFIDDWDPEVHCDGICMDLNWSDAPDEEDFLIVIREYGEAAILPEDGTSSRVCLDGVLSTDGFVDLFDIVSWDWALSDLDRVSRLNMCLVPLGEGMGTMMMSIPAGISEGSEGLISTLDLSDSLGDLLIAGKRNTSDDPTALKSKDRLYVFDRDNQFVEWFDSESDRCNIRLVKGPEDELYQINSETGVLRLGGPNEVIVPPGHTTCPNEPRYNKSATVYVGIQNEGSNPFGRPILDAAFDGDYVYIVPVVVDPYGEQVYAAAAKLQLLDSADPPYEVVQLYDDPPPAADNQCRNNLREIEIDSAGNVYILNAHSLNEGDLLWKYGPDGMVAECLGLGDPNSDFYVPDPIAMHMSDSTGTLYLTSAQYDQVDMNSTILHGFSTDAALIPTRSVPIDGVQHVTDITEDPATGSLWAVGFNIESMPEFPDSTQPPFYYPCLARIPYGSEEARVEALLGSFDLGLPMSIVWTGTAEKCGGADLDESGNVEFRDFAILAQYWLDSNCDVSDWCGGTDFDRSKTVNSVDLAVMNRHWLETGCNDP